MRKVLVTGALGQIGSELVKRFRKEYDDHNVIVSDVRELPERKDIIDAGPFELIDVTDGNRIKEVADKYKVNTIVHLAALLSAVGEKVPQKCWQINMGGLFNVLEVARENECQVFTPSSIACFGPDTPKDKTPQTTLQRPTSMYGVTKVAGENLCDYYHLRFGVDTRGVRFPGIISYDTLPGGGTTDYAVDIYYDAIKKGSYECFIKEGTYMDMMYMPDALNAVIQLIEADGSKLIHRNAFNIAAMSFEPEEIKKSIQKFMPEFTMTYNVDPVRQAIADSWPNSLDDSCARAEWGWKPEYDLDTMSKDMLEKLREKLK